MRRPTYDDWVLTPGEVKAFNERAAKYGQVEASLLTWAAGEPVALSLTLRATDEAIRHTRAILRAKGVRGLRLLPDRVNFPEVGCIQIRNIEGRQWEEASFEVIDIEQNETVAFYCAEIEAEFRTY